MAKENSEKLKSIILFFLCLISVTFRQHVGKNFRSIRIKSFTLIIKVTINCSGFMRVCVCVWGLKTAIVNRGKEDTADYVHLVR